MTTIQNISSNTAIADTITILTCTTPNTKLTKEFTLLADGTVHKQAYGKAKHFTYEEKTVSNLNEMLALLTHLQQQPLSCIIRGTPKQDAGDVVRRLLHDDGCDKAAFEPQPRHWVMVDLDKIPCPTHLNPATAPEDAARWAQQTLSPPFNSASCIYKFSSSQNVRGSGDTASLHFMFLMDRPVSEQELKWFFKENPCNVDQALFSAVQIHYTASPIFHGMEDPLPKRVGMLIGKTDIVAMPKITLPKAKKASVISGVAPNVGTDNRGKALAMLLASYPKSGGRDRFCGAVAGVLCRGGWPAEKVADFVMELAEAAHDEESPKRYDTGMRIYDAITNDRPAMGIPTLRDEYGVQGLDEILELLGVGKPDVSAAVDSLSNKSTAAEIEAVVGLLAHLSLAEREVTLEEIKEQTGMGKTVLNKILRDVIVANDASASTDNAVVVMETMLEKHYESGRHLLRSDGVFWHYTGTHWGQTPDDLLKQQLLAVARETADDNERVVGLLTAAMNMLGARVFKQGDPLRFRSDPPTVMNCKNGEIWFDDKADITFKPHLPESYLRYCIKADYNPSAKSPQYDKAILEIFQDSSNPLDMRRHAMELLGYLCQPWRKLAIIVLLYGGGNNGKTVLITTATHLLGQSAIMACRMNDIEKSQFSIGALANKYILLDDDVESGTLLPDGFLKKISEEKMMTGEHKHKDSFEFICRAVPVMLGNDYPAIKDMSYGLERRLLPIPFAHRFTEKDMKLGLFDRLWKEEASGILNQVIAGFQRLHQRGRFQQPDDCLKCKKEWLARSNILAAFIDECCEKVSGKSIGLKEFYTQFCSYCVTNGIKNPLVKLTVKKRLESLGYEIGKNDVIKGLQVQSPTVSVPAYQLPVNIKNALLAGR